MASPSVLLGQSWKGRRLGRPSHDIPHHTRLSVTYGPRLLGLSLELSAPRPSCDGWKWLQGHWGQSSSTLSTSPRGPAQPRSQRCDGHTGNPPVLSRKRGKNKHEIPKTSKLTGERPQKVHFRFMEKPFFDLNAISVPFLEMIVPPAWGRLRLWRWK